MSASLRPDPLTVAEQKWIERVNRVLAKCPSKRLGFATMGDPQATIYDKRFDKMIEAHGGDFLPAVDDVGAELGTFNFPSHVHSTAA